MGCSDSLSPSAPLRFLRSAVPPSRTAAAGPPRFLGDPPVRAVLFDPGGSPRQTIGLFGPTLDAQRCCLPLLRRRRPPHPPTFEAQSHGPYARCLRFAATVTRCFEQLRKTRFRLVVLLGRTGFEPAGLLREVSASVVALHWLPPHPGFSWRTEGIGEKHRSSDMVGPVKLQRFSFSSFSFLA
jgi:hypothetical protein